MFNEAQAARVVAILREAGEFDAADKVEASESERPRREADARWQQRWEDDTWDLH